MSDSSANRSYLPVMALLVLNLLMTLALLAHVVYYIPEHGSSASAASTEAAATAETSSTDLWIDGVGNIGMSSNGIELELIELNDDNPSGQPNVVKKINMSQEKFLDTLNRMNLMRDRLIEKDLIREVE